ncbi:hypothetical protein GCM10022222_26690 [Amycolatopsis ultiminotia]|uniref:Tyr recombinase domain-containing protein n=2 Tax=Amycolatopsis ultiminotia TaxID=543629 RepID=A0ABP6VWF8_9PSEU
MATRVRPHTATAETRHSYVTHLLEFGYPPLMVQQQVGHAYQSTTALYTNPRELHQVGENLQVACWGWFRSGRGGPVRHAV